MSDRAPFIAPDRRAMLGGGLGVLATACWPDAAEAAAIEAAKLQRLIKSAMAEKEDVKLARPAILGFTETKVVTRQLSRTVDDSDYYFAVIVPKRDDGLMFFRGSEKPTFFFAMHRTGNHLRRLVSALNRDGKLGLWSGQEAEDDFAKQLSIWAES